MTRATPVQARATNRRLNLLTAAVRVIDRQGPDGPVLFTTDQVAREAGCSIGTFYRYFVDRADLLAALYPDRQFILGQPRFAGAREYVYTLADGTQVTGVEIGRTDFHVRVHVTRDVDAGTVSLLPLAGLASHVLEHELIEPPAPTSDEVDAAIARGKALGNPIADKAHA